MCASQPCLEQWVRSFFATKKTLILAERLAARDKLESHYHCLINGNITHWVAYRRYLYCRRSRCYIEKETMELCVATGDLEHDDSTAASSGTSRTDSGGPSLFEEIDEAINMCTLTYTLTMLRRLVREDKIQHRKEDFMRLPISLDEADELVLEEKHHLTLSKYSENKRVFTSIVKTLSDRQFYNSHSHLRTSGSPISPRSSLMSRSRSGSRSALEVRPPATIHVSSSFITAFGGERSHNGLVFGMSVNIEHKTVTLCFRGAETDVDWAPLNTDVYMKDIPNPMKRHGSQPPTVKIHNQLHELLIRPTLKSANEDWDMLSEYQEILEEHVIPTLLENPGYKVSLWVRMFPCHFNVALPTCSLPLLAPRNGAQFRRFISYPLFLSCCRRTGLDDPKAGDVY